MDIKRFDFMKSILGEVGGSILTKKVFSKREGLFDGLLIFLKV